MNKETNYLSKKEVWEKIKYRFNYELERYQEKNKNIIPYWDDLERFFKFSYKDMTKKEVDQYVIVSIEKNYTGIHDMKSLYENGILSDENKEKYIKDEKVKTEVEKKISELEKVKPEYLNFWNDLDNSLKDYHINVFEIKNNIIFDENYSYWVLSENHKYETVLLLMKNLIIESKWCTRFENLNNLPTFLDIYLDCHLDVFGYVHKTIKITDVKDFYLTNMLMGHIENCRFYCYYTLDEMKLMLDENNIKYYLDENRFSYTVKF